MIRTLTLVAIVAAMVTPANARPPPDWQCGKDRIITWRDKEKWQIVYEVYVGETGRKRLPARLFRYDAKQTALYYKGKKCREVEDQESDQ
jgi:hypothetical protein